jgi:HEAT repeat protein
MIDIKNVVIVFKMPGEAKQRDLIVELSKHGNAGRDALLSVLTGQNGIDVKRWAVDGLGYFNDSKSKEAIKIALENNSMTIKLHAIRAILKLGDKKLAIKAKRLIDDQSGGIRINTLDLLVHLAVPGFRQIIQKCLKDEKPYIRKRAMYYKKLYAV